MKPLSFISLVTFTALVAPSTASAKCYRILAAKEAVVYECKSSPNSFPGVIRDTLQFKFQGATVVTTEDEKCPAKAPACEDEKAAEAVAELHRTGIRRHAGSAADSQNACNDKINSPSVCGRTMARPSQTGITTVATQGEAEGPARRGRYHGRYGRPPEVR